MRTLAELKFFSQKKLTGRYGLTIGVTLTIFACDLLLSVLVEYIVPPKSIALFVAYECVIFLLDLLLGMLLSGQTYLYMNILYDRQAAFSDLKQGFIEHPEKAMMLQLPFAASATIATAPLQLYQFFFYESRDRDLLFWCMVIAMAGLIAQIVLSLVFSQVYYLLHDFPERRVPELFGASAKLMRGHIGQYFLLLASYIPWLLISAMLFFIPALFIMSQMNAAQAAFYQRLMSGHDRRTGSSL